MREILLPIKIIPWPGPLTSWRPDHKVMSESTPTSLYIVPTPIGNLADITLRALEILKSVNTILAEDTRTSGFLLKQYSISKPLQSFHNFNEHKILSGLVERMMKG